MPQSADDVLDNEELVCVLKDSYGAFVYANRQLDLNFDLPKQGMIGKTEYHFMRDTDAAQIRKNDQDVLQHGHNLRAIEYVHMADGTRSVWLVNKFRIVVGDERFVAVVGKRIDDGDGDNEAGLEEAEALMKERAGLLHERLRLWAEKLHDNG